MKQFLLHTAVMALPILCAACAGVDLYKSHVIRGAAPKGAVTVTWLGTAGLFVTDGKTGILIDPYLSRFDMGKVMFGIKLKPDVGKIQECVDRLGRGNISIILVSHSHFDHVADVPFFARITGAPVAGTESSLNVCRGAGLPEGQLKPVTNGTTMKAGAFTIRFIESKHGPALFGKVPYPGTIDRPLEQPARASDYRLGGVYAIVISHPTGTLVHHGSAGFLPGMYDGVRADLLLLGIAGRGETDQYLAETALKIKAPVMIPIHFDNFFKPLKGELPILPNQNVPEFFKKADAHGADFKVVTLPVGEPVPAFTR
jgi:L-ascorbate metabolism protein UlaG (beta-lactamase superfamily)